MTVSRQVRVVQAVRKNWEIEHREPLAHSLQPGNVHRVIFFGGGSLRSFFRVARKFDAILRVCGLDAAVPWCVSLKSTLPRSTC